MDTRRESDGGWDGGRREMIRRNLDLSPAERLALMGSLHDFGTVAREASTVTYRAAPPEITLTGCRPTPLASYLKALGILRLVAEQADSEARGRWVDDSFRITTTLTRGELLDFFLTQYRPTPMLAPWNGGSGFYPDKMAKKKAKGGPTPLGIDPIRTSRADRFADLRRTIVEIQDVLAEMGVEAELAKHQKSEFLVRLRAELNDTALTWFDAAILLTDEPRFPPLLGTGGNDGRLDFTNNFLQRLGNLLDLDTGAAAPYSIPLLRGALFDEPIPRLWGSAMGQYAPADMGGANATTGFSGSTVMNPWDFVLLLEGALLFAASASRRLESGGRGRLSYPFTVRPTGAGSGSTAPGDEASSRGEVWMPLWRASVSLPELRSLMSEGRAVLNGRPATDGLDFVRAVSKLGVDRGISEFVRYGFLMRNGKAYLAAPLTRVRVHSNPESELVDQLDRSRWLSRVKRATRTNNAPARLVSLGRRLQDGLFRMAKGEGGRELAPARIQDVLITLGEIQRYFASAPRSREAVPPVPALSPEWVRRANDGTPEFLISAALAGIEAEKRKMLDSPDGVGIDARRRTGMRMAMHLAPVPGERSARGWMEESREVVWGEGDILRSLRAVLERRLIVVDQAGSWEKPLSGRFGAPLWAVAAWMEGGSGFDQRVGSLLPGLALAQIPHDLKGERVAAAPLPIAYAMLKPFFTPEPLLARAGLLAGAETDESPSLPLPLSLVRQIALEPATRGPDERGALPEVYRRLRLAPLVPPGRRRPGKGSDPMGELQLSPALRGIGSLGIAGHRLLPALMVPLSFSALRALTERLFVPSDVASIPSGHPGLSHHHSE